MGAAGAFGLGSFGEQIPGGLEENALWRWLLLESLAYHCVEYG